MGNCVRDPELKTTSNGIPVCNFTLAIERRFKNSNGDREVDFINFVSFRSTAEFVNRFFHKGSRMIVVGSIQVRSYEDKDGNKRIATEIVADEVYFGEKKAAGQAGGDQHQAAPDLSDGFFPGPNEDTSLPFDL
jgi:single-strand DNA-binding protein